MGLIICLTCILFLFLFYDFLLTVIKAFSLNACKKISKKIYIRFPIIICALAKTYANFKVVSENDLIKDLPEQYLLICNHQSLFDVVAIGKYLTNKRVRFIAKGDLKKNIPLVSNILTINGHCIINRKAGPSEMMQTLDVFADNVKRYNWIPVLFPEGTRSKTGKLNTLHSAGFRRLLIKSPMPVVVFAIDGGWKITGIRGIISNLKNGTFRIKALKVFPAPTTKVEQKSVLEESQILIQNQLDKWRK